MLHPPPIPEGSTIEEVDDFDGRTYRWKPPGGGPIRFLIAGFLIFWLCGWSLGFVSAVTSLIQNANAPDTFLIVWLAGWTVGGIFACVMVFALLRPPKPECITLKRDSFHYDSGTTSFAFVHPWHASGYPNPHEAMARMFKRRQIVELSRKQLGKVVLERIGERQRLYFDRGADRIEIGMGLREPEREWLADVIKAWQTG